VGKGRSREVLVSQISEEGGGGAPFQRPGIPIFTKKDRFKNKGGNTLGVKRRDWPVGVQRRKA